MKARIDTKTKTLAIEEAVSMDELVKFVKGLFPEDWKQWKLETNVKFDFHPSPVIIREVRPYWESPVYYGSAWCGTTASGSTDPQYGSTTANLIATQNTCAAISGISDGISFIDYQPDWSIQTSAVARGFTSEELTAHFSPPIPPKFNFNN